MTLTSPEIATTRILLVEDDMSVRSVFAKGLRAKGFHVTDVGAGEAALSLLRDEANAVDLLITDVVMPGMNGRELSERASLLRPNLRVLFVSGYADDEILRRGLLFGEIDVLAKPFSLEELSQKIDEVLGRRS
jgi:two-component system, cell cycle sensor histidine kinase and response regulator CckA